MVTFETSYILAIIVLMIGRYQSQFVARYQAVVRLALSWFVLLDPDTVRFVYLGMRLYIFMVIVQDTVDII